jgi:hypothetical protein
MKDKKKAPWRWRVGSEAENDRLGLLYEPGNWGDVLKGNWAAIAARWIARARRPARISYADVFAGTPDYSLVPAAAERLASLPPCLFRDLQAPHARSGRLASTALLVEAAAHREGAPLDLHVFDADPERQAAWRAHSGARLLEGPSGEDALLAATTAAPPPDLTLVDPYDLLERWPRLGALAVRAAARSPVLLYLYNKSPRGGGHARAYDAFRRRLHGSLSHAPGPSGAILGRVPADPVLPSAFHEVILLGGAAYGSELASELRELTLVIARHVAGQGAFEELGGRGG